MATIKITIIKNKININDNKILAKNDVITSGDRKVEIDRKGDREV